MPKLTAPLEALACIIPPSTLADEDAQAGVGTEEGLVALLKRATPDGRLVKVTRAMVLYRDLVRPMARSAVRGHHPDDFEAMEYLIGEFDRWLEQVTGKPVTED